MDDHSPPSSLKNLGRSSDVLLGEIGIGTVADLRALGAMEAWERLRFAHGKRITVTFLYALEGALCDCDWRVLPTEHLQTLKAEANAYLTGRPGDLPA